MKLIKTYWKPTILSWLIFLPLTILLLINRQWSWYANILTGIVYFFLITLIFSRNDLPKKQRITNLLLIITPILPLIVFYIWRGPDSYLTAPLYILNPIIGIVVGLVYLSFKKFYSKTIAVVLMLLIGYGDTIVLQTWMDYFIYGTWSGLTDEKVNDFCFTNKEGKVCKVDFKNKIVVLDFWNTSCGSCYAAFPEYTKQITKWSKQTDVEFYTVNVPIKTDSLGQADNVLKKRGYNFNNLIGFSPDSTNKIFKVVAFPTTIVFDKSGNIVYRGNPNQLDKVLEKLIE